MSVRGLTSIRFIVVYLPVFYTVKSMSTEWDIHTFHCTYLMNMHMHRPLMFIMIQLHVKRQHWCVPKRPFVSHFSTFNQSKKHDAVLLHLIYILCFLYFTRAWSCKPKSCEVNGCKASIPVKFGQKVPYFILNVEKNNTGEAGRLIVFFCFHATGFWYWCCQLSLNIVFIWDKLYGFSSLGNHLPHEGWKSGRVCLPFLIQLIVALQYDPFIIVARFHP